MHQCKTASTHHLFHECSFFYSAERKQGGYSHSNASLSPQSTFSFQSPTILVSYLSFPHLSSSSSLSAPAAQPSDNMVCFFSLLTISCMREGARSIYSLLFAISQFLPRYLLWSEYIMSSTGSSVECLVCSWQYIEGGSGNFRSWGLSGGSKRVCGPSLGGGVSFP